MSLRTRHIVDFALVALVVALVDLVAKNVASVVLAAGPQSLELFGRALRFVLVYNDQSAFGVSLGPFTRELNVFATSVVLVLAVPAFDRLRLLDRYAPLAIGLIAGAAIGNLVSMLTSPRGVIDFIALPLGRGELVFNLADVAAYAGLALLVRSGIAVWREMKAEGEGLELSGDGERVPD